MHIGIRLTRQNGGGGAASYDAMADALSTRAGIDWRPWEYATTLFTDTAGTVAASAPGDIIAVQKSTSKPGLQFQQTTLANRPILVRHPKRGVVNELLGNATLSTQNVTTTAAQRTLSFTGTGTVTLSGTSTAGPLVGTGVSDRVSLTFTPTAGTLTLTVSGSVTAAQLQLGAAFDSLQTVSATGYDITEPGQAECWGLFHNGTSHGMETAATLDLSGSDKVGLFVGTRKLSDATASVFIEFSATSTSTNQTFAILTPSATNAFNYLGRSRGTVNSQANTPGNFRAPVYSVLTLLGDIAGDSMQLRVDGVQSGTSATDQGSGNYGNQVLYKGARAGASVFYRGIDWGGCVVSGLTTSDTTIVSEIESQIAENTPGVETVDLGGAWTWFNDDRVLELGSDHYAVGAVNTNGDIVTADYNGTSRFTALLSQALDVDDHCNPGLLKRASDGKIMAWFSAHDAASFWQSVSSAANDATSFGAAVNLDSQLGHSNYTYANAVQLDSGRIYLFFRATNTATTDLAWHYSYSDNDGTTWATGVQISTSARPYHKIRKNGANRIDIIVNDGHPSAAATNKVYHYYLLDTSGAVTFHESDGTDITASIPFDGTELAGVYDASSGRSWVQDLQIDGSGNPVATFTVYPGATDIAASDIRGYQGRWNGSAWAVEEICTMGVTIYDTSVSTNEPFYSGGMAGVPGDPDTVYIGRMVDGTGAIDTVDGIHQIFRYEKSGTWSGTQITTSADKCFRPFIPQGTASHLFYCEGRYTTYEDFNTRIRKLAI